MGIIELVIDQKTITSKDDILKVLRQLKLYWLIDSICESARIEIKRGTVIWHSGLYLTGNWHWGIFLGGDFWGNWQGGIWEGGNFDPNTWEKSQISQGVWTLVKK